MNKLIARIFFSLVFLSSSNLYADLVWSETFLDADDAATDRAIATGSGNMDVAGNLDYLSGALVITPDGGSDRVEMESTAAALAGNFTFDAFRTGTGNGSLFVQMVDGDERSTGSNTVADFSDTLNMASITTSTTINYYFNVSGAPITYAAPDATTETLANNAFELWIGTSKSGGDDQVTTNNDGGLPTAGVDTLILQTFVGQAPGVYTFDNISFNTVAAVPEPSSMTLFGTLGLVLLRRKRR
ncbi:hypothetical protein CA13_01470 [Planctomycetes bacterium CA13]|uniref:Ice-binding protein C-terminal domain-containing protein n=1 Tax=Novipirellula herctigrandis TaxID=2527986 RepID=A0A5C5YV91_9BACT|nr:hypothetical protein CA13_01470 [Planctomycetes bacterium CA13]